MIASTASIETKISNIRNLRFETADSVKRLLSRNGFIKGGVVAQDERGFYVGGEFEIHPLVAAMPTQEEVDAHNAANPPAEPVERKAPVRNIKNGACDLIRAWARANPEATREDALAQFPDLNPATVKIQFRKVRLGQV